ncbi:hypothetical protein GCM10009785_05440 [Brooklawnia cerclae]|uniref:Large ribosomal subunit protein bL17 n=1 Tax=Brooklawnia cerclae TaxID=349934 RepID=A0ABX0SBV0_9ACTN|nr:50S ribosomal protein L17 [Brooklawnia cerclae]NIH55864.1 large subunit ribosomal protein L17 [Brooklawnia cerclae]
MPKPTKGPRLGGTPAHERIILANLASQLFEHGRITTTETRARRVQPLAEKLISKAKRGDLHARRLVNQTIADKGVIHVLFTEIAPTMEGRDGGYTRITKIGPRKGDNAPMAIIELVTEAVTPKKAKKTSKAAEAAEPVVEEETSEEEVAPQEAEESAEEAEAKQA